MSEVQISF